METFGKFFDYYEKLRTQVPEKYSNMGEYGRCYWDHIVSEGLIASFPKDTLEKRLKKIKIKDDITIVDNYDENLIKIIVSSNNFSINEIIKILKSEIIVFGYVIGRTLNPNNLGQYIIIIEPIHSKSINPNILGDLYHITHNKNLNKILEIGLVPRDSKTIFEHPRNRIYLLTVNNNFEFSELIKMLISGRNITTTNLPDHLKFKQENMSILKISKDGILNLYEDPMFGGYKKFKGFYTTNNIKPNYIEIL